MLAAAVWAGLGLAGSEPPRGKSGSRGAQVLRLVVADSDPATGDLARRLARHVRTLSGGTLRVAVSNASPEDAVARPRVHPTPDVVDAEPGVDEAALDELEARGRTVRRWDDLHHYFGGVSCVGRAGAAGDPRRSGAAIVL